MKPRNSRGFSFVRDLFADTPFFRVDGGSPSLAMDARESPPDSPPRRISEKPVVQLFREAPAPAVGRAHALCYHMRMNMRCAFLFLFVAELSAAPAWLFSADWNLLKATRRGPVPADEWFRADVRPRSFALVFR